MVAEKRPRVQMYQRARCLLRSQHREASGCAPSHLEDRPQTDSRGLLIYCSLPNFLLGVGRKCASGKNGVTILVQSPRAL